MESSIICFIMLKILKIFYQFYFLLMVIITLDPGGVDAG